MSQFDIKSSELGKKSHYRDFYSPDLLFPIPRSLKRIELFKNKKEIDFYGVDIWNAYELYWLNEDHIPRVAVAKIIYDANSEFIIESKSLKLYLNSFNGSIFKNHKEVSSTIRTDLAKVLKVDVICELTSIEDLKYNAPIKFGILLDEMDFKPDIKNTEVLNESTNIVEESLYTHLLKSNCLVTGQPDFGSLFIRYKGLKIDHKLLLNYIISLRNLNEFHEECVERIFEKIYSSCGPEYLEVFARYTRRGGIDINPFRSSLSNFQIYDNRVMRQ